MIRMGVWEPSMSALFLDSPVCGWHRGLRSRYQARGRPGEAGIPLRGPRRAMSFWTLCATTSAAGQSL
jgi:hypothetical protein